jgi:hypothetical protein
MTCQLHALCLDANDPLRIARFWASLLGWEMAGDRQDGIALLRAMQVWARFLTSQEQKATRTRCTST